jgi:hypothetical protein
MYIVKSRDTQWKYVCGVCGKWCMVDFYQIVVSLADSGLMYRYACCKKHAAEIQETPGAAKPEKGSIFPSSSAWL